MCTCQVNVEDSAARRLFIPHFDVPREPENTAEAKPRLKNKGYFHISPQMVQAFMSWIQLRIRHQKQAQCSLWCFPCIYKLLQQSGIGAFKSAFPLPHSLTHSLTQSVRRPAALSCWTAAGGGLASRMQLQSLRWTQFLLGSC